MSEIKYKFQEDVSARVQVRSYEDGSAMLKELVAKHKTDETMRFRLRRRKTDGGFHVAFKMRHEIKVVSEQTK